MGMLFQKNALFDSMTIEENVKFPLDMFTNMTQAEKKARVDFCLDRVNLVNANKKFPSEISGGMMKRVALARAIVLNPKYLFCDEPNSGLDPKTSIVIDELIQEITREFNITTVINTHDMNSVIGIGDKIVYFFEGEKNWEGSNKEVLNTENENLNDFIFASTFLKEIRKMNAKKV
jgi:phospholipid/cholesterol/gamma-HCH transport system ATP-binding protein